MSDTATSSPRELPLLLGAGKGTGTPESLLLIGAPDAAGQVVVRRWTADDWSAVPSPRPERADALLRWLEEQSAAGRSMNQSMYALRLWLRGQGVAVD
jgi:hypothetical protein